MTDRKSFPVSAPDQNRQRGQNCVPEQSAGPLERISLLNPEIIDLINKLFRNVYPNLSKNYKSKSAIRIALTITVKESEAN